MDTAPAPAMDTATAYNGITAATQLQLQLHLNDFTRKRFELELEFVQAFKYRLPPLSSHVSRR
jgi:hypothetical protein